MRNLKDERENISNGKSAIIYNICDIYVEF